MDNTNTQNATTWRWVIGTVAVAAVVIAVVWAIQHNRANSGVVGDTGTSTPTDNTAVATTTAASATTDVSASVDQTAVAAATAVTADAGTTATGGSLSMSDQPAGNTVVVSGMNLTGNSWVAIKGANNWYLGAAWFPKGTTQGSISLLRNTVKGSTYTAVIFADDGSKKFDFHKLQQVTTADGKAVTASFTAQ